MSSNTFIRKVDIKGTFIYTKILWKDNAGEVFHIQIFDDSNNTWSGAFTNELAEECMQSFEDEDLNEYKTCAKLALTANSDTYVYDFIEKDPTTKIFRWKRRYEDSVIEVHGSVPVQKDSVAETKNILIDILLKQNEHLDSTISNCKKNIEEINRELEKCKEELVKSVDMKISLEETLYGKFVQILNEKKRRIRLLEENLQ